MKAFFRALPCGHFIFIETFGDILELTPVADSLVLMPCDICGREVSRIEICIDQDEARHQVDVQREAPLPRHAPVLIGPYAATDIQTSERLLRALGGDPCDSLLTPIRRSVLAYVEPSMRAGLETIPVGMYSSFSPNAKTIFFRGESSVPVVILHWGLSNYIFLMNCTIVPTIRLTFPGQE